MPVNDTLLVILSPSESKVTGDGVAGLLILPVIIALALLPLAAVGAGYFTQSLLVEYGTLALFAGFALLLYYPLVKVQGRSLERHERAILDVVARESDS